MNFDKDVRAVAAMPASGSNGGPAPENRANRDDDVEGIEADRPDPQRAIFTSCISRAGESALVVIAEEGMIDSTDHGETGFYVGDMRIVSKLAFRINKQKVKVLRTTRDDLLTHFLFDFEPISPGIETRIDYSLDGQTLIARLHVRNAGSGVVPVAIDLTYEADHFDTFYVRFPPRPERGTLHAAVPDPYGQSIRYDGLDDRTHRSFIRLSEQPEHLPDGTLQLNRAVRAGSDWHIVVKAGLDPDVPRSGDWEVVRNDLQAERIHAFKDGAQVASENPRLRSWLQRSADGLSVMTAEMKTGLYPYAGLPWFAVPFGRDGLISGFQTLLINPAIMEGVLRFHAQYQAQSVNSFNQSQPGKIMHEMRRGETSISGLNPFEHYYGAVDTTPLFVMAVEAYWRRTNDEDLLRLLWPHVDLALAWLANYGDKDGDGFIEYAADPGQGLVNQGWKDSSDSIMHANGHIANGPIALAEVQGYAYRAWRAGEAIGSALGFDDRALACGRAADRLYQRFNEVFWQDDMGVYALALDGKKRPCRVLASNIAHLPWCGITPQDRGQRVMKALMSDRMFSGWGIRTLAAGERSYRADSYHRGPCWPHEMAIASWSADAVGDHDAVRKIAEASLDAAESFGYLLPELFCGFPRVDGLPPIPYKSANPLQAWSVGSGFGLLESVLGIRIDAANLALSVDPAGVPPAWKSITLKGLQVGSARTDIVAEPDSQGSFRVRAVPGGSNSVTITDRSQGAASAGADREGYRRNG